MKQNSSSTTESSGEGVKLECAWRTSVTLLRAITHIIMLIRYWQMLSFKERQDIQIFNQIIHILPCYAQRYFESFIN